MLALSLPPDVQTRLDALARQTGRSPASFALEAIVDYLDDLEDEALAEQRLSDIAAGREKTIPLDEVMKSYGLAD